MEKLNEGIAYHTSECPQVSYSATSCKCGFVQKFLARDKSKILPCPEGRGGKGEYVAKMSSEPMIINNIDDVLRDAVLRASKMTSNYA